jgi:hypothetical protein
MVCRCVPPRGLLTFLIQRLGGRFCLNGELRLRQTASSGLKLASVAVSDSRSEQNHDNLFSHLKVEVRSFDRETSRRIHLVAGSTAARSNRSTAGRFAARSRSTTGGLAAGSRSTAGGLTASAAATVALLPLEQLWHLELRHFESAEAALLPRLAAATFVAACSRSTTCWSWRAARCRGTAGRLATGCWSTTGRLLAAGCRSTAGWFRRTTAAAVALASEQTKQACISAA